MINLFDKELNVKDYSCSEDNITYDKLKVPTINVYVQVTGRCNANCSFCKIENICEEFDFEKFELALKNISRNVIIGKVAITGGEPLLCFEKTKRVIKIAKKYSRVVTLNTNATKLDLLYSIYPFIDAIDISRHHYDDKVQNKIMQIDVPSLDEIRKIDEDNKISINCVLQKGAIDNYEKAIEFLEYIGKYNIGYVKFISLLPLTDEAKIQYVDPSEIIAKSKKFTNSGMLHDMDMCCCFEFLYLTNSYNTIRTVIRHTTNSNYSCVKQFVFNGKNLFDGFAKNNIIC